MEHQINIKSSKKLWDRIRLIYSNIQLVGNQLKSQFDNFNATYRNINRYFSKHFSRNPSEIEDLVNISLLKSNPNSTATSVFLQENDFKYIDIQLSIYQTLQNLHNILTNDVVKILAKEHLEYFQQSKHDRGFNKVLKCISDTRMAIDSLKKGYTYDNLSCSESDLPPQEKLWYLYCLTERELFASCNLLESVDSWEKNSIKRINNPEPINESLPLLENHHKSSRMSYKVPMKHQKNPKKYSFDTTGNHWQDNLRNHIKPSSENFSLEESIETNDFVDLNQILKICKWNFKEPSESSRLYKPLCDKTFLFRNKQAVSKPHGIIQPYLAKISVTSRMTNDEDETRDSMEIDLSSGRVLLFKETSKPKQPCYIELQKFNKKLSSLQESINRLIADQETIEKIMENPLRDHVQKSLDWLRSLYLHKSNHIQNIQNEINKIKVEKAFYLKNSRKK